MHGKSDLLYCQFPIPNYLIYIFLECPQCDIVGTKDCDGSEDTHCNCYTNYYVPNSNCSECEGDYQKIFDICEGKTKYFFLVIY